MQQRKSGEPRLTCKSASRFSRRFLCSLAPGEACGTLVQFVM